MQSAEEVVPGAVEFDPSSVEYFDDPFPLYKRMRDEAPVYHNSQYGFWALTRYRDVMDATLNWSVFSSTHGSTLADLLEPDYVNRGSMINMDPPSHERYRALVNRAFTPRAIAAMEATVVEVIQSYLDPLADRDEFDVVADFSAHFPNEIISTILGVPPADRVQVRLWSDATLSREEGNAMRGVDAAQAFADILSYFADLVREKRRTPGDDMLSRLAQAEIAEPDGPYRLTDEELANFAFLLGAAGSETVTKLVGNAAVLFDRNRDEWRALLDDPSLLPAAAEEVLRYWAPSHLQGRYTTQDITLHSVTIPARQPVFLVTGAANRDDRAYPDPDVFSIRRTDLPSPLGLGYGVHYCLGAALARTESRIAISELAKRWPAYEVDDAGLRRVHMANVAGYSHVPVSVRH
jgi:cytochrome P450